MGPGFLVFCLSLSIYISYAYAVNKYYKRIKSAFCL